MDKVILVTGAAGMIGSCAVRELNEMGKTNLVLVDDLKGTDKWKNLVGKEFRDLISKHAVMEWLKGKESEVEAIIHLGACSDTTERNADYLLENNFRFTVRLAEWALTHGKRFVYASSAATYGDGSRGFSDDEEALSELKPLNMYGFSKHLVDLWMKRENVLGKVVGLKYFNVFGPNEYHKGKMASMVLKMAHIAASDQPIGLYKSNDLVRFGHGEQKRDFIYVKDAVRMTLAFLKPEHLHHGGIYNVGRGVPTTWNELAFALFQSLGKKENVQYIEMPEELSRQYQNYTCADMRKFHKIAPQEIPQVPIGSQVKEYVQEYLLRELRW